MSTHDARYTPSAHELTECVNAAIEALLWTTPVPTETGDDGAGYLEAVDAEFDATARRDIYIEVVQFIDDNTVDLDGLNYEQIGHDFTLTRNHHGAGFWDRGLGERGERLTLAAEAYGGIDAFIQDDGTISAE